MGKYTLCSPENRTEQSLESFQSEKQQCLVDKTLLSIPESWVPKPDCKTWDKQCKLFFKHSLIFIPQMESHFSVYLINIS